MSREESLYKSVSENSNQKICRTPRQLQSVVLREWRSQVSHCLSCTDNRPVRLLAQLGTSDQPSTRTSQHRTHILHNQAACAFCSIHSIGARTSQLEQYIELPFKHIQTRQPLQPSSCTHPLIHSPLTRTHRPEDSVVACTARLTHRRHHRQRDSRPCQCSIPRVIPAYCYPSSVAVRNDQLCHHLSALVRSALHYYHHRTSNHHVGRHCHRPTLSSAASISSLCSAALVEA